MPEEPPPLTDEEWDAIFREGATIRTRRYASGVDQALSSARMRTLFSIRSVKA